MLEVLSFFIISMLPAIKLTHLSSECTDTIAQIKKATEGKKGISKAGVEKAILGVKKIVLNLPSSKREEP